MKYGVTSWSSTYKTHLNKLSFLQNKAVKIVGGGRYCDRATPFYSKLGILKLVDLAKFEKAIFVFKHRLKALPASSLTVLLMLIMFIKDLHGQLLKKVTLFQS